ncbi:MAG: DUF501 domain-containing protein [Firmicutes bacterium]|nr:DUF501 domain-containing protein [Bacillota bacterium]
MQSNCEQATDQDLKIITEQLGREPQGVLGIANRCRYGYPQVIINRPVISNGEQVTVFPTSLWLTCPYLRKQISKIESTGLISTLQSKVADDPDFAEAVKVAHQGHAEFRRSLIPNEVLLALAKNYPNEYQVIAETGVGGTRSYDGVKCLHAHFADFLVLKQNAIGKMIYEALDGELDCSSGDCELEN